MSISSITIIPASGTASVFNASLTFGTAVSGSTCDTLPSPYFKRDYGSIALTSPFYTDIFAGAYAYFENLDFVRKLSNSTPYNDGTFFLLGSDCTSVGLTGTTISGSTVIVPQIIDLCPSCSKCDDLVKIYRMIEYYKIWINRFKDTLLYTDTVANSRTLKLKNDRMTVSGNCAASIAAVDSVFEPYFDLKGLRLLQQYVTLVHMWNYIAVKRNNVTEIHTAPEDNSGILVQTKHALPKCGAASTSEYIQCRITLTPSSVQSGLSVYTTQPKEEFKPFQNTITYVGGVTASVSYDSTVANKITVTSGQIRTSVAGTYLFSVRFLPFFKSVVKVPVEGSSAAVLDRNWSNYQPYTVSGQTSTTQASFTSESLSGATCYVTGYTAGSPAPTLSDYYDSKMYPSKAVTGSTTSYNRWNIYVQWLTGTHGGAQRVLYEENLVFESNKVREYFGSVIEMSDVMAAVNTSIDPAPLDITKYITSSTFDTPLPTETEQCSHGAFNLQKAAASVGTGYTFASTETTATGSTATLLIADITNLSTAPVAVALTGTSSTVIQGNTNTARISSVRRHQSPVIIGGLTASLSGSTASMLLAVKNWTMRDITGMDDNAVAYYIREYNHANA